MQPLSKNIATNKRLINNFLLINSVVLLDRETNVNSSVRAVYEKQQFVRQIDLTNITSKNPHLTLFKNTLSAEKNTVDNIVFVSAVWNNNIRATETENAATTNNYEHLYIEEQRIKNNDRQILSQSLIFALYIYILQNNGIQSDCFSRESARSGRAFFVQPPQALTSPTLWKRVSKGEKENYDVQL